MRELFAVPQVARQEFDFFEVFFIGSFLFDHSTTPFIAWTR